MLTDENASAQLVHLVSQDGESFDVPVSVARLSEIVKTMIDGSLLFSVNLWSWISVTETQDTEEAQEIPLPNVKATVLAKVIEFCKNYEKEPMQEIEKVCFSFSISTCWFLRWR